MVGSNKLKQPKWILISLSTFRLLVISNSAREVKLVNLVVQQYIKVALYLGIE